MTTRAAQIELLLDTLIDPNTGAPCAGYSVEFYSAGTSTAKNVWTEKEKTNPFTTYTLDSGAKALLYGDGVYKIIVKNIEGTAVLSLDNVKIQATTFGVRSLVGADTATPDDDVLICSGAWTLSLQTVANFEHPLLVVNSGAGVITIDPYSSQTIDGSTTYAVASGDHILIVPDNDAATWWSGYKTNITGRPELTTPADADAVPIYDVSAAVTKYITSANLLKVTYLSAHASLSAAITTIGATETRLVIDTDATVSADLTVPANVELAWYKAGQIITVATGQTLTINGSLSATPIKIFTLSGTGAVAFGTKTPFVYAEWWGALADDSTDGTAAIQAAMSTAKPVHLLPGTYHISDTLNFTASGITLLGAGRLLTVIEQDTNAKTSFHNFASTDTTRLWCRLENFKLVGGASLGANAAIDWKSMQFGIIRNLWITGQSIAGCKAINLEAVWTATEATYNLFEGLYIGACAIGIDVGDGANTCWVRNSRFQVSLDAGHGIYLEASAADRISNFSINNCSFEYPLDAVNGIYIAQNTNNVRIVGCRFESLLNGIYVGATSNKNVFAPQNQNYFSSCTTNINLASGVTDVVATVRASVSFVGSTGVVVGRAHNFTVARNGAGDYTLTFVNALPDAGYAVSVSGGGPHFVLYAKSTTAITIYHYGADHSTKADPATLDVVDVIVTANR